LKPGGLLLMLISRTRSTTGPAGRRRSRICARKPCSRMHSATSRRWTSLSKTA
jgi:hypothetical protein